ncbi:hypothetical protein ACHAWO_006733 [Cyclotella atomus]|uniref:JmjC domain-containing protein n=1 Tax=Cyclotella atomus TaxID=382360 RepID=A0ABD3MLH6_9STRA
MRDSSDLQRRRPASSRTKSSGGTTTIRRRKRKSDPNRTACVAALAFVAVFAPLGFIANRFIGHADTLDAPLDHRFLQEWKPKLKHTDTTTDDTKSAERETRYHSLYHKKFGTSELGYDVYDCPPTPPPDYPKAWSVPDVLTNWNPKDVTTLPPNHRDVYHSLCIFDYVTQYDIALTYRNAEKPFVIRNDPKVDKVVEKWDDGGDYLHSVLGDEEDHRVERSPVNNFMWYRLRGNKHHQEKDSLGDYVKPLNDETTMTYGEWLEHALEKDGVALGDELLIAKSKEMKDRRLNSENRSLPKEEEDHSTANGQGETEEEKDEKWYYFRLNANIQNGKEGGLDAFVYDELSFFDPRKRMDSEFYIVDPKEVRGINCRFGMRGVIAANHFDMSRNMIAILGGERRYIIAHPSQCKNMALYPRGHPSLRHSSIDWSNPSEWDNDPNFRQAQVTEVIMHAGDVLYLPTSWFHYIINFSLNFQCNARSGTTYENEQAMNECGF